jgi:hypothetical protein
MLLACALSACASPTTLGDKAARLVPGRTTIDEAIAIMGQPKGRSAAGAGMLLQWFEWNSGLVQQKAANVAVLFDGSGRMVRITQQFRSDP